MLRRKAPFGLIIGALAAPASADLLFYEPFDYADVGTELSTADGSPGIWQKVPATTTLEPLIASGSLPATGLPWTPAGNSVSMTGGTTAVQASSTRQIPGLPFYSADEPTMYYSLLFRVNDVTGTVGQGAANGGSFVAGFRRDTGTGGLNNNLDAGAPLLIRTGTIAGTNYQLGTGLTASVTAAQQDRRWDATNNYTAGETLLLVFSYEFVAGGEDFARMWVNPDASLSEQANSGPDLTVGNALKVVGTATDGHGITDGQITNLFLRNNGSAPDAFQVDEVRVSNTWDGLWDTIVPGIWQGGVGNWSQSAQWSDATVPASSTMVVQIDAGNAAASVVTLDQNATIRSLAMNSDDVLNISSGQALTMLATSTIQGVINSSGTINAPTINVNGAAAQLHWNDGDINLTRLQLSSGGKMFMAAGGDKLLKIAANSTISTNGSQLDVADNKVVVIGGDLGAWNGSNYTGITGFLRSGRNGGAWDGVGIITSMTDATTGSLTGLAVAKADDIGRVGTTFGGHTLASGDVMVMYTYDGDANLSGDIDGDDFAAIDSGFSAAATGYHRGDFDYSGLIDADDYWIIDANYGRQGAAISSAAPAGVAAVPEPAGAAVLGVAAVGAMRRRRRR